MPPTCADIRRDILNIQAEVDTLQKQVDSLASNHRARLADWWVWINDPSADEIAVLAKLRSDLAEAIKRLNDAKSRLAAAIEKFNKGATKCKLPPPCTGKNSLGSILTVSVPEQTRDTSDLQAQRALELSNINALKSQLDLINKCLNAPPLDFSTLYYDAPERPTPGIPTFPEWLNQQAANLKNECVTDADLGAIRSILTQFRNWPSVGEQRRLSGKAVRDIVKIIAKLRADRELLRDNIMDCISASQSRIDTLDRLISDYSNPLSAINQQYQDDLEEMLNNRAVIALANIKGTLSYSVTAKAGPLSESEGGGVQSTTVTTDFPGGMASLQGTSVSLNPTTADVSAAFPGLVGSSNCKEERAHYYYPGAVVTATITITNINEIINSLGNPLPGNRPATVTGSNPTITLTKCID